jgi:hypothetical protein
MGVSQTFSKYKNPNLLNSTITCLPIQQCDDAFTNALTLGMEKGELEAFVLKVYFQLSSFPPLFFVSHNNTLHRNR